MLCFSHPIAPLIDWFEQQTSQRFPWSLSNATVQVRWSEMDVELKGKYRGSDELTKIISWWRGKNISLSYDKVRDFDRACNFSLY